MMNKNHECEIIFDLLPLYVEETTSKESNEFVQQHILHCEECRKNLQYMIASYEELVPEKSTRRKKRRAKSYVFGKAKSKIFVGVYLCLLVAAWIYIILCFVGLG